MNMYRITSLVIPALLAASIAGASWPNDSLINVPVSTVPGEKYDVFTVTDGQNGALIAWEDDRAGWAEVGVYDLTGRLIDVLAGRTHDADHHSVVWNGQDATGRAVPSGPYVIRLETESGVVARKVMLLR